MKVKIFKGVVAAILERDIQAYLKPIDPINLVSVTQSNDQAGGIAITIIHL